MNTNVTIGVVVGALIVIALGVVLFNNRAAVPAVEESAGTSQLQDEQLTADELGGTDDPFAGEQSLEGDTISLTPSPVVDEPAAGPTTVSFTVIGSNFKFDPAKMSVKQGDTVRITLTNNSTFPHDWKLDEFNAATKTIQPGQTDTIEFVADKAGSYEYYCSVGNHRQMGMKGTLVVE